MKRALLIGIDQYKNFADLNGCVNDVEALEPLLKANFDGSPAFSCQCLKSSTSIVSRATMLDAIDRLLRGGADVALLFFAGHGRRSHSDVVLVSQDGTQHDIGVALSEILGKVSGSTVPEVIVVLDCCFAGGAGGVPQLGGETASLRHGVTLLSASRADQTSAELSINRGVFSYYLCAGLEGGAADVLGKVTVANLYAYLSESFGPWDQRPTFKTNVDRLHELRLCDPALPLDELRQICQLFPTADYDFPLDPSFEPDAAPDNQINEAKFRILQHYEGARLLVPVGEEHMYFAAINSKSCRLTALGKHYHKLAKLERI